MNSLFEFDRLLQTSPQFLFTWKMFQCFLFISDGVCIDELNSFRCRCPRGLSGQRCDIITDYCALTTGGLSVGGPCLNGATCVSQASGTLFACRCPPSFVGPLCQHQRRRHGDDANRSDLHRSESTVDVVDAANCTSSKICLNGGTCVNVDNVTGVFRCACVPGYVGVYCESRQLPDVTSSNERVHPTSTDTHHSVGRSTDDVVPTVSGSNVQQSDGKQTVVISLVSSLVFATTVVIVTVSVTCCVRRWRRKAGDAVVRPAGDVTNGQLWLSDVSRANNLTTKTNNEVVKLTDIVDGQQRRMQRLPADFKIKNILFV